MSEIEVKAKRSGDGNWSFHDEDTGEPLATATKRGSGKYASFDAQWHPHVVALYPELAHPFNSIEDRSSEHGISGQVQSMFHKLKEHSKRTFDYREEQGNKEDSTVKAQIFDKETGKTLLHLTYPQHKRYDSPASREYKIIGSDIAGKDHVLAAEKKAHMSSANQIDKVVKTAEALKDFIASGGPRFEGDRTHKSEGRTKVYKTKIENPEAAIRAYADSGAVHNHQEFSKTMVSPNMMLMHRPDGQTHIISHGNGMITHTSTDHSVPAYASPLAHVIESKDE